MELANFSARWGVLAAGFLGKLVGAIVVLSLALLISSFTRKWVYKGLSHQKFDVTLTKFFANLTRYFILTVAVLGCLGMFGVQTTSLAAVIGAAGFAVALAFQGTLSNFSSGVMLLVFRPFKVGDVVNVAGVSGKVNEIALFTVQIDTPDNRRLTIPNSSVFGATIENLTFHKIRRVDVTIGTSYNADLDFTRSTLEGVVSKLEKKLKDPPSQIVLTNLGASSVDWTLRVWARTEDYWDLREAMLVDSKKALDEANIGIPFPQVEVNIGDPINGLLGKIGSRFNL